MVQTLFHIGFYRNGSHIKSGRIDLLIALLYIKHIFLFFWLIIKHLKSRFHDERAEENTTGVATEKKGGMSGDIGGRSKKLLLLIVAISLQSTAGSHFSLIPDPELVSEISF